MIFPSFGPVGPEKDHKDVLEILEKLLGDIEYLGKGEMDQDKANDILSVLRLDSEKYSRALREAIRSFKGPPGEKP